MERVSISADTHSPDSAQNCPLHLAAGSAFLDAVVKLVELPADLNCRNMSDCTWDILSADRGVTCVQMSCMFLQKAAWVTQHRKKRGKTRVTDKPIFWNLQICLLPWQE